MHATPVTRKALTPGPAERRAARPLVGPGRRLVRAAGVALWLGAALALGACGGGSGGGGEPVGGTPTPPPSPAPPPAPTPPPPALAGLYTLSVDADPLRAVASADGARAVSQRVRARSGATLQATGADGTLYTLRVPDDALTEDTTITMTPLASLAVAGAAGVAGERQYGVVLAPDGLSFFRPVELAITPAGGVSAPLEQQIPLGWSGPDGVLSLASLADRGAGMKLSLMHFSGYALVLATKGMNATLAGVEHRLGGSDAERIASALANEIKSAGNAASAAAQVLIAEYVEQVVKPRLAAAASSCAAARLATQTLLQFTRQLELLGMDADAVLGEAVMQRLASVLESGAVRCMKEEFELCRDEHIITRVIPTWLGLERQAQLLGVATDAVRPAWLDTVEAYAGKCLRFELQFSSSVQFDIGSGQDAHAMRERVETTVPIRLMGDVDRLGLDDAVPPQVAQLYVWLHGAPTALISREYAASYADPCVSVDATERLGGAATVPFLAFTPGEGSPSEQARVLDFTVALSMVPASQSRHTASFRSRADGGGCRDPVTETVIENWGSEGWAELALLLDDTDFGTALTGWTIGSGDILATKDLDHVFGELGSGRAHVRATAVLLHRPAPD